MLLDEGTAVVVEDRWKVLAASGWSQAVVQSQGDGGQLVPELVILLGKQQNVFSVSASTMLLEDTLSSVEVGRSSRCMCDLLTFR